MKYSIFGRRDKREREREGQKRDKRERGKKTKKRERGTKRQKERLCFMWLSILLCLSLHVGNRVKRKVPRINLLHGKFQNPK